MAIKADNLEVVIDSDEELGVLDTGFIEDYYGVDGYLTLYHVGTAQEFSVVMANVAGGGPYPNDHFEGTRDATAMPLGAYEVRGRVRDVVGNYTILSAFQNPNGNEGVQAITFSLDSPSETNLISVCVSGVVDAYDLHLRINPDSSQFLIVDKVDLDLFVRGQVTVSWSIENTALDVNLFSFFVERSGSPEGPFTRLNATGLKDEYEYVDLDASYFAKTRFIYYRIVTQKDAENEITRTEPGTFYEKPDLIGIEIARRNQLLLDKFVGSPCVIHKKRHWGKRCEDCWDKRLRRKTKSGCVTCFDTGYEQGYWKPIGANINFNPSPELIKIMPWGKTEPSATAAWISNYPLVERGDVVTELTRNRRWLVTEKVNIEKLRVPIKQIFRISEMEKSRVEFKLALPV